MQLYIIRLFAGKTLTRRTNENTPFAQFDDRHNHFRGGNKPLHVHQSDVGSLNFDPRRASFDGVSRLGSRQKLQETLLGFKNRHKLQQILASKRQRVQEVGSNHRGDPGSFNGRFRSGGRKNSRRQQYQG